jgi:iron complex outermembrane receptor protein
LTGVPAGTHQLRVSRAGFLAKSQEVTVRAGEETLVAVALDEAPVELDAMVVSASRRAERQSEAPATVTRIGPQVLENVAGNSFVGALKQANGLDYVQVGMTAVAINARGFNSSFNNRMLMLEDGRIAVLPENGLPVGAFSPIPKVDLAGIEVIVGPGSALYGADASNGVLTLQSKDPREYPGTTVEVTGGNRQYADVQFRHAGVAGGWGYKLSGEYNRFDDWENRIRATAAVTSPWERTVGDTAGLNWESDVIRGYGGIVRYLGEGQIELTGGWSRSNGVGQTNVGRNQLVDWTYNVAQLRATFPNFYASVYRTESDAGDSYAVNRYTLARVAPANAALDDEAVRQLSDWPSNGQLYAAEFQNNFRLRPLLNTQFTWGAQYRHDVVSSEREWLTDRLTGEDLEIDQWGVYGQAEIPLAPQFRLLLAGRYDDHENYDPQFSPKAGFLFTPVPGQTLRFFYNRAFKSPSTLQTNFYIPNFSPFIGVFGNRDGFEVRNAAGNPVRTYEPLVPEENQTFELGYKGLVQQRLFVDAAVYYSRYEHFMSPLTVIANPLAGAAATTAYGPDGLPVTSESGQPQVVLTYFNLGEATIYGTDLAASYVFSPRLDATVTLSLLKVDEITGVNTNVPGEVEATAINSPVTKFSVGVNARDMGNWLGGLTMRHVIGYRFNSGINKGTIPTFSTVDVNVGYRLPNLRSQINLGVANLFTCRARDNTFGDTSGCGFGVKHTEMINMPRIGTMIFLGMRYDTR